MPTSPADHDSGSTALFYVDEHGRNRDDGLFGDDVPGDPHAYGEASMQRAMAFGMSRKSAFEAHGPAGVTLEQHDAEMARRATRKR